CLSRAPRGCTLGSAAYSRVNLFTPRLTVTTIKGIRVLLLSVSSNKGSRGYLGSKPISIKGSNRPNNFKSRNRK
ncbi:hypothetical protein BDR22DRAFT_978213, partial [Usnea florida]